MEACTPEKAYSPFRPGIAQNISVSASSSSRRFLEAVTPAYAVVSVGPDNSNLPREETLLRLEEVGAAIYRTDTDGDLVFSWDGEQLSLWSEYHEELERTEWNP